MKTNNDTKHLIEAKLYVNLMEAFKKEIEATEGNAYAIQRFNYNKAQAAFHLLKVNINNTTEDVKESFRNISKQFNQTAHGTLY